MWRTYTGANPLSTRNFNPGRTTVLRRLKALVQPGPGLAGERPARSASVRLVPRAAPHWPRRVCGRRARPRCLAPPAQRRHEHSSATWLSNLGAAISSLDKMNYEPSGVPANQHIYAANVRPVDALPRGRDSDGVWRLLSATAAERRSGFQPVGDAK